MNESAKIGKDYKSLSRKKYFKYVGGIKKKCIFAADFPSGSSSVGRAQPCQGWGREFESRFPLKKFRDAIYRVSIFFKISIYKFIMC